MIIIHPDSTVVNWLCGLAKLDALKIEGIYKADSVPDQIISGKTVWGKLPVGQVELAKEYWHVSFPPAMGILSTGYLDNNAKFVQTSVVDTSILVRCNQQVKNLFMFDGLKALCPICKLGYRSLNTSSVERWMYNHVCNG